MRSSTVIQLILGLGALFAALCCARAQTLSDATLARISFDQKLNSQVSLDAPFRDELGAAVKLRDYFDGKPVILVLGYYRCPMLCTLLLNGMIEGLEDVKWSIGNEFEVINVSIDPRETPELAAAKKRSCLKRYGRSAAPLGWHFLTGREPDLQRIADEVGFHYAYDAASAQYAHPSGLIFLTPGGKVSGYLFGVNFSPKDLYASLAAASSNKIGSPIQRLVLLCFHYSPITGKYGAVIMRVVRALAAATVVALAWWLVGMFRRDRSDLDPPQGQASGTCRAAPVAHPSSRP